MILKDAYTNNYFTELWSLIAAATLILYIYMYILSYLKINRGPPPLMGIYPLNFVIDYVKLYILYINAWFNRLYLEFENCNVKTMIELLDQYVYSTWPKLGPDSHTLKLSSYHKPILTSNYCNLSLYK